MSSRLLLAASCLGLFLPSLALAQKTPIQITADLRDTPRKLFHAEIDIPVTHAGPLSLTTPEWIPGNHRPTGPVSDIVGVVFTANGQTLTWRRDDEDLYQFHVEVPKGVTSVHAHLDCIATARLSQHLAMLEWEKLLLYPADTPVREIPIQPTLIVPTGWGVGTALTPTDPGYTPEPAKGGTIHYAATNVEQLEDSPVITGEYFHEYPLAPDVSTKHYIDVVADDPEDAKLHPEFLAELTRLVHETGAAYASRHYKAYHFLLTLSDVAGWDGLEHGQSSDNGVEEAGFADADHQLSNTDLLPHEFTHSWNGKYRRPFNLYQDDFHKMQQGSLLWVYEGLTQYMGEVLAARSGLESQQEYRDNLAYTAAMLQETRGREWRSTEDTAISSSILRDRDMAWSNWRRSQDYYPEGTLVWLDADTLIRQKTDGKKSLTDFLHIFLGKGGDTGPLIVTYNFDELVRDLNEVLPYDWAGFLRDRVMKIAPDANVAGIERGGYKLVYTDKASDTLNAIGRSGNHLIPSTGAWFSIGLLIGQDNVIQDVRWNSPADKAQLAPGYKLLAVNGHVFSMAGLNTALTESKNNKSPITLLIQVDDLVKSFSIDDNQGPRWPALKRVDGTPDLLDAITTPLTPAK
ncbi:M61 family peptidase [Silvibacterium sp.]|uniref:M61 family metallopeptidase n=1 Tax=Silvibacterium sp. TaxID=1964179 RepID=UPI0039E7170D